MPRPSLVLLASATLVAGLAGALASAPGALAAASTPKVAALSLMSGTPKGGSRLTITGTAIASAKSVTIGGKAARVLDTSSGTVVVATPAHSPGAVQVRVTTAAGTSPTGRASQFRYFTPSPASNLSWSDGAELPNRQGGTIEPSCPTTTFCVAADGFGNVTYYDGSTWSQPQRIDTTDELSLSCPATTFCMATDNDGRATRYDGSTWTTPTAIDSGVDLIVTCGSPTLCIATTPAGDYLYYNGTSWTSAAPVPDVPAGSRVTAISCKATRCVAGTSAHGTTPAELIAFDGSTWTDLGPYSEQDAAGDLASVAAISCATAEFCFINDDGEHVSTLDGIVVTHTYSVGDSDTMQPVTLSCATTSSCLLIQINDASREVLSFDGTTWTPLTETGSAAQTQYRFVSCATAGFCMIGGPAGVAEYTGSSPIPAPKDLVATVAFDSTLGTTGTSCVPPTFCMNASNGVAFSVDGTDFGPSEQPTPEAGAKQSAVSCATTTFCVFTSGGRTAIFDGTSWGHDTKVDGQDLVAVACGSRSFCAAYDDQNRVLLYNGTTWTTPKAVDGSHTLHSISCAGSSLCVVTDNGNGARTYRKGAWSARTVVFPTDDVSAGTAVVSCGSTALCMAVDGAGAAARYDGSSWHRPVGVTQAGAGSDPRELSSISCVSSTWCRAFDANQAYSWSGTSWSTSQHVDPVTTADGPLDVSQTVCASKSWCFSGDYVGYRIGSISG